MNRIPFNSMMQVAFPTQTNFPPKGVDTWVADSADRGYPARGWSAREESKLGRLVEGRERVYVNALEDAILTSRDCGGGVDG